jgi:hypothetical protein
MAGQNTKNRKTKTVRIYEDSKEWVEQRAIDKATRERRQVYSPEILEEIIERERKREKRKQTKSELV